MGEGGREVNGGVGGMRCTTIMRKLGQELMGGIRDGVVGGGRECKTCVAFRDLNETFLTFD